MSYGESGFFAFFATRSCAWSISGKAPQLESWPTSRRPFVTDFLQTIDQRKEFMERKWRVVSNLGSKLEDDVQVFSQVSRYCHECVTDTQPTTKRAGPASCPWSQKRGREAVSNLQQQVNYEWAIIKNKAQVESTWVKLDVSRVFADAFVIFIYLLSFLFGLVCQCLGAWHDFEHLEVNRTPITLSQRLLRVLVLGEIRYFPKSSPYFGMIFFSKCWMIFQFVSQKYAEWLSWWDGLRHTVQICQDCQDGCQSLQKSRPFSPNLKSIEKLSFQQCRPCQKTC